MSKKRKTQIILPELAYKDSVPRSLYGNRSLEEVPEYDPCGGEKVYGTEVNSNCFIVLGNDRNSSKASGKGGHGYTQCGKIDLIAGLNSANMPHNKKTNPNFFLDGARLYLSQKSNVDAYFGLVEGTEVVTSDNQSAVAMKADHVRMIARNHIKLVTGSGRISSAEKDSKGEEVITAGKIDFIAGNSNEPNVVITDEGPIEVNGLQPLVKGENLERLFKDLLNVMIDIQNQTFANKKALLELALNYQSHIHLQSFPPGAPTSPSPMAVATASMISECFTDMPSSFVITGNITSIEENYFNENLPLSIKSKNVSTT